MVLRLYGSDRAEARNAKSTKTVVIFVLIGVPMGRG
jgi:hypothetical protein